MVTIPYFTDLINARQVMSFSSGGRSGNLKRTAGRAIYSSTDENYMGQNGLSDTTLEAIRLAADAEARRLKKRKGSASTILTSSAGLSGDASVSRETLGT